MPVCKTLENGLRVVTVPYPTVGSVTLCLRGLAGSNYEKSDEIGAAHLLEHFIVHTSNKNLITQKGGRITATTSRDEVAFLVKTLKENYEDGLKFLSQSFFGAVLDQTIFEKVKGAVYQEIYQNIENPELHIGRIAYKILFPNQRISIFNTGNILHVKKLSYENLLKFRKRLYKPSNFVLVISGNVKSVKFFKKTQIYFSKGGITKTTKPLKLKPNYKFGVQVERRSSLSQTHIRIDYIGFKANDTKKYPSHFLSKVLRAELRSAIDKNKIVNAYMLKVLSFSSNSYGLFSTYIAINQNEVGEFFKIYNNLCNKIKSTKVQNKVHKQIKNKIKADFEFSYEKTSLRADLYSELILFDQVERNYRKDLRNFLDINKTELIQIANELFSQEPKITILDKNLTKTRVKTLFRKSKL